jgi:hypothetical protein
VAASLVTFVEGDRIAGHKPAHDLAERRRPGAKSQVKVVGDQGPAVTLGLGFFKHNSQTL